MSEDLPTGIQAGAYRSIAVYVENLCKEAKAMGGDIRVAVSDPDVVQDEKTLAWRLVTSHQFLDPGQMPSLPGACKVYGPFPG